MFHNRLLFFIFLALTFNIQPVFAANEDTHLISLTVSCGKPRSAEGNAWRSTLYGVATPYTFQASRYWNSTNYNQVGQHLFEGYWTENKLVIVGKGKWEKRSNIWRFSFTSKGEMPILEHLKNGVSGVEGEGKWQRKCEMKLIQAELASKGISSGFKEKAISRLPKERNALKKNLDENDKEFQQRLTSSQLKIEQLQAELVKLSQQNTSLIEVKNELTQSLEDLSAQRKNFAQGQMKTLEKEVKDKTESVSLLNSQLKNLSESKKELELKAASYEVSLDKITKELNTKSQELEEIQTKLKNALTSVTELRSKEKSLTLKLEKAELEVAKVSIPESEKLKEARENIFTLTSQLTSLQKTADEEANNLRSINSSLKVEVDEIGKNLGACEIEVNEQKQVLDGLTKEYENAVSTLETTNDELVEIKSKLPKSQGGTALCIEW